MEHIQSNISQDAQSGPRPFPWQLLFLAGVLGVTMIGLALKFAGVF
jgi:hypothetical protein